MSHKESYRQICAKHKDIPLFLQDWWLDAVCSDWDAAIVMNGAHLAGIWPYRTEQKLGISFFRNPVLTPYLGPHIFFPSDLKESKQDNFEHEVTAQLLAQIPQAKVWSVALFPAQKQTGLFRSQHFEVQPRQTFLMSLDVDEETIFSRLNEDYRRNIRKADDISITDNPALLPELWEFQKATLERKDLGMHFSLQQMQQVFDACRRHGNTALWVARKNDIVQAILWHVWDNNRGYYLAGSKNPAIKDSRAMTALIWKAISESKKKGLAQFDFEGSMDPGVEKFFRNFGAQRELYLVLRKNTSLSWKIIQKIRS